MKTRTNLFLFTASLLITMSSCTKDDIIDTDNSANDPVLETPTLDSASQMGFYEVATLVESDGLRNGPGYAGATVYYPINATPPYSSIVIVPGFTADENSIADWGPFYASHGIIAMTIGTNSIYEFPNTRALALLDAIISLKEENSREASPLYGKVSINDFAVSGWSMGGGGAQLAATLSPSLKAVVALCPWLETNRTAASFNHSVPVLLFSGQDDTTATPDEHSNVHYNFIPNNTEKLLFEVTSGTHYAANSPLNSNGDIGRVALSWVMTQMNINPNYRPLLFDVPNSSSIYQTNLEE